MVSLLILKMEIHHALLCETERKEEGIVSGLFVIIKVPYSAGEHDACV